MCPTFFLSLVTWYRRAGTTTNTLVCSTEYLVGHNYNIYNKTWTHNEFHFWFKQKKTRFYSNLFMCANCNVFFKTKNIILLLIANVFVTCGHIMRNWKLISFSEFFMFLHLSSYLTNVWHLYSIIDCFLHCVQLYGPVI